MGFHLKKEWWVLISIGISAMIVLIDFTIVNTALAAIQVSLNARISELQWVMAAFGLTFATLLTLAGRLGDLWGRRKVIYIAMGGFLLTSIGAGISTQPWELILMRFLQGIFAAPFFPCGLAIVSDAFPPATRKKAIAIYGSLLGIGLAIGPLLGGWIVQWANWRWIFFINVPVILLSFFMALPVVSESKKAKGEKIDWMGAFLLVLGLASLLFAITEGPDFGWGNPLILLSFAIAALLFVLFYLVERRVVSPICPFHLFTNRGFLIGTICYVAGISCVWALMFLLPLYLQNVLNYHPDDTGSVLFLLTLMTILSPFVMGLFYERKGIFHTVLILFITILLGYILFLFFSTTGPLWLIILAFLLYGWGWGASNGVSTTIAVSHLKGTEDVGVVSGAALTVLNVVAMIWLAIGVTIFRTGEKMALTTRLQQQGIHLTPDQEHTIRATLSDPSQAQTTLNQLGTGLSEQVIPLFRQSFVNGFHLSMGAMLLWTLLLFFLVLPALRKER